MRKIEKMKTGANDRPSKDVAIADCGSLPVDKPFTVKRAAVA